MGNLSLQDEGIRGTVLSIVQASKARPNPGKVISQIQWITKTGTINPRDVDVPFPLVDYIVISPRKYHWQTSTIEYDPRLSYRIISPINDKIFLYDSISAIKDHEKVIARRVLLEFLELSKNKQSPTLVN
jgi:acyl CoA:acetate/3-ketoacid CoA transferase